MIIKTGQLCDEALAEEFFQHSEGEWRSQRRYYTLKSGAAEEVVSEISIKFLGQGSADLIELAQMHELEDKAALICGTKITWESHYIAPAKKQITGSTVFGVLGNTLFRDRGFATSKPVTAEYFFRDSKTMHLRTEYSGSVFEEEIKLVGTNYRTRQTIISRAGEELMIGQYLEKRKIG